MRCPVRAGHDGGLGRLLYFLVVAFLDALEQAEGAPGLDVAFGRGLRDAEPGCQLDEGLGGEMRRQRGEELLLAFGALEDRLVEFCRGELPVDADGVVDEGTGDGHGGGEIFVVALQAGDDFTCVGQPERREDHRDPEGDEPQAADAGHDVVAEEEVVFVLGGAVVGVEGTLLGFREREAHFGQGVELLVEVEEAEADVIEDFVERGTVATRKYIDPLQPEVDVVEDETREKAVLGIGNQGGYLAGRSGEDGRQTGPQQLDELPVLAAGVGYGFVVEGLAEAITVVAEVGTEDVGQGIALGFEHQSVAAIVVEDLIDRSGAGVGRDDEHPERGLFGRLQFGMVLLCVLVADFLDAVLVHLVAVEGAELVVDGLREAAAEREAPFAGRGRGRDEEEEVGEDLAATVDAEDLRDAG